MSSNTLEESQNPKRHTSLMVYHRDNYRLLSAIYGYMRTITLIGTAPQTAHTPPVPSRGQFVSGLRK